jgi:hypothetical protein
VTDVVMQLPRRQRNDVAFELRALLDEGLQDKAEDSGRAADAAMALEFLRAFGRPEDVAARYRQPLTVIDPADGRAFLRAALIGLVIIWCLGLVAALRQPVDAGAGLLGVLGQWWKSAVIPSPWWPGVLVVWFGAASWARRRWPQSTEWTPRAGDRIPGGRATLALGLVGIVCGLFVLLDPPWILDFFWGGRAAPAAYQALTYTEAFRQRQAPWLFGLLMLNIPLLLTVMVQGRWSPLMRRLQAGLGLVVCAVLAWIALDGPVFIASASDRFFKLALVIVVAFTLIGLGVKRYRHIRPAPNHAAT